MVSIDTFIEIRDRIIGHVENAMARECKASFGITPEVAYNRWTMVNCNVQPKHYMWELMFLKVYAIEVVLCQLAGAFKKTFKK